MAEKWARETEKARRTSSSVRENTSQSKKERMCFRVDCKQCGKYTWGGCGKHLATLYNSIESGERCMCRSWPGVVVPAPAAQTATVQLQPSRASASAATGTARS